MKNIGSSKSIFSIVLPLGVMLSLYLVYPNSFTSYFNLSDTNTILSIGEKSFDHKHRGAHVFGRTDTSSFDHLKEHNLEWIALVAWSSQVDIDSPEVNHHNGDSTYIRSADSSWIRRINLYRDAGFKVFLKPHVWIRSPEEGKWRSDITHDSEAEWESWKTCYTDFILRYARIAEETNTEMYCIGTEFTELTKKRPEYWRGLIKEVRKVYSGKITYGANWYKEYKEIPFWDDLDYIGVQAYFPLTDIGSPNADEIAKGWKKHLPHLRRLHKKYDKKILFTEMGYKSTASSAKKPWEWLEDMDYEAEVFSPDTQANCYEAFFESVWKKPWFAGVYIWQMRGDFKSKYWKRQNKDFTPQGKLAASVIAKGFEKS